MVIAYVTIGGVRPHIRHSPVYETISPCWINSHPIQYSCPCFEALSCSSLFIATSCCIVYKSMVYYYSGRTFDSINSSLNRYTINIFYLRFYGSISRVRLHAAFYVKAIRPAYQANYANDAASDDKSN